MCEDARQFARVLAGPVTLLRENGPGQDVGAHLGNLEHLLQLVDVAEQNVQERQALKGLDLFQRRLRDLLRAGAAGRRGVSGRA